ncbi:hypothetical protein C1H69_19035 [Billgrantia endophytica]|uniref:Uncharacterized protein n=1 Tax=Billgrantia endophytica TaxID=2033802 RepID=A0A2N7TXR6_9GAMM|nr:hypothetical protein C1H69_19035 [Halomonas endophytica]
MDGTQVLTLGLGLQAPWILKDQHLDTSPCRPTAWISMLRPSEAASTHARSAARPARPMTSPTRPGGI